MKTITAKRLKNQTGEALRYVEGGEKVLITRWGKPLAVLAPATGEVRTERVTLRPFPEAWAALKAKLKETTPPFPTWQEALRWSRRRG